MYVNLLPFFLAGLPRRSSQQTCSMDTVRSAFAKATARQPSLSTSLRAKAGGEGS
jgi:hypothetical protein